MTTTTSFTSTAIAVAEPVLVDRATGRRVDGPDFVFTAGPAASRPFQDRYAARPKRRQP